MKALLIIAKFNYDQEMFSKYTLGEGSFFTWEEGRIPFFEDIIDDFFAGCLLVCVATELPNGIISDDLANEFSGLSCKPIKLFISLELAI